MKKSCVMFLVALLAVSAPLIAEEGIRVQVDSRVELLSVIFRLAGNNEYCQPSVADWYEKAVEEHFKSHKDHGVVKLARQLRREHGVSFDAVMGMAIHVDGIDLLKPLIPLEGSLDKRWTKDAAAQFLAEARSFVKEAGFELFFEKIRPRYEIAVERLNKLLREKSIVQWLENFFGPGPSTSFELCLSFGNGPCCYGPSIEIDGKKQIYCILGMARFDDQSEPLFEKSLPTIVHEFTHSFANPIIDIHANELSASGKKIFPYVESAMRRAAYSNWKTMYYESLVRAVVIRYLFATEGLEAARQAVAESRKKGFLWIAKLAKLLGKYEKKRKDFPTIHEFMPHIVTFFEKCVPWLEATKNLPPTVVSLFPKNGATGVAPDIKAMTIVFDVPMRDKGWSICGGGPSLPEMSGEISYDASMTSLTVPVKLKANHSYQYWINSTRFKGFKSAAGVPVEPIKVEFSTGP